MTLSSLDVKILHELQLDASRSTAELAECVGSSPASCWRRIRALEAQGVLGPTVRLVPPKRVGRSLDVFCHVRMKAHDALSRQEFERTITLIPSVVEIYAMSGEWDYLLHCLVTDIEEYQTLLMDRILSQSAVANSATIFSLNRIKYSTVVPV